MVAPTAAQMKEWSQLDFASLGFETDVKLGRIIARAVAALQQITGLSLSTVEPGIEPLVEQAVQGLTEQLAYQAQPDIVETLSDFDLISSFSAGPYSETRRSPGEAFKARMLNAWPWLSDLLWTLLTPDKIDFWNAYFGGDVAPAFAVSEVDWGDYMLDDPPMFGPSA